MATRVLANPTATDRDTLPMSVENMPFMVDRLGADCAPLQYIRELTENAIAAIDALPEKRGEIIWDVDWNRHALTGVHKLAVIDTGSGMTGPEMVHYINKLSSSIHEQRSDGNYGVGAKIAAAPHNRVGIVYLSWKNGVGSMIHLWRNPDTGVYGLRRFDRPDGTTDFWGYVEDAIKPQAIKDHGTMVILLGNDTDAPTMKAPDGTASPARWIARYLNSRYFSFPDGVVVRAREGWDTPDDKDRNKLRTVTGQEAYLMANSESRGVVDLTNARARWWILKDDDLRDSFLVSGGHAAALYQDELYELSTGRSGVARLQSFGVIFGYGRVVIYVEPVGETLLRIKPNIARTHLLLDKEPLPWADWASEFRANMPDEITDLMNEVGSKSISSDHRVAIRDRLKNIRDLFRVSRYRPSRNGHLALDETRLTVGGKNADTESKSKDGSGRAGGRGGRAGDIYALFLATNGQSAEELVIDQDPDVRWISVADGTRTPPLLDDRAAKYLPDQNLLLINADFRVFTDMTSRWCERYASAPGAQHVVEPVVHEWFEQQLMETVLGAQALKNSPEWTVYDMDKVWSEEALTAAALPRYHIDLNVKRALGAKLGTLRDKSA